MVSVAVRATVASCVVAAVLSNLFEVRGAGGPTLRVWEAGSNASTSRSPAATATSGDATRGSGRIIQSDGCVQRATCSYFSDILVIIHLNPQRFDWVEPVLNFALKFVPHVMLTSIPESDKMRNMSSQEQRAYLDHLVIGDKRRYVHLIDNGFGLTGAHHDIVKAMQLYPNYTGYLYWAHEDALPGFWNMVSLDKESVWHQQIQTLFAFSHQLPLCTLKLMRRWKLKPAVRIRQGSHHCVTPYKPHQARDWVGLYPALEKIKADSLEDFKKVIPGVTFATPLYYAPKSISEKFTRYSAYLYDVKGVNEWADHVLLRAASNSHGSAILKAVNIWPDQGRFNPVKEFSWDNHITHPIRPVGELFVRLADYALTTQVVESLPRLRGNETDLWSICYSCDQYPLLGSYKTSRKGRFHTCEAGCKNSSAAVPVAATNGVVEIRNNGTVPPSELEYEGFWSEKSTQFFFSRYATLNRTT